MWNILKLIIFWNDKDSSTQVYASLLNICMYFVHIYRKDVNYSLQAAY